MSDFSAQWLALREAADAAARHPQLTAAARAWRQRQGAVLSAMDLASGTGANVRFLAPRLGGEQRWLLVERDPALLVCSVELLAGVKGTLDWRRLDLVSDWERLEWRGVALVTASALLDLVSAAWLERLAEQCRDVRAAVLIVLSYDGSVVWQPRLAEDALVCARVNRHQRGDKGFGPALGPNAAPLLAALLRRLGYTVKIGPSPWRLQPQQRALQTALLQGWLEAAQQIAPTKSLEMLDWRAQRQDWIERGESRIQVGHWDIFAWLDQ